MKIKHIYVFILICMFFINCKIDRNPCSLPQSVLKDIHEIDSIINTPNFIEKTTAWNENHYDEPVIYNSKYETYRFRIGPSFENTRIYRIKKEGNSYKAIVKEIDMYNSNSKLIFSEDKEISESVWNSITRELENNDFWIYRSRIDEGPYLDGTSWLIEGYKPRKDKCTFKNYHAITRLSLKDSIFKSMCNSFLTLDERCSTD